MVLVHGYANPWMLLGMAICRARGIQYLVRGEAHPDSRLTGLRRCMRDALARIVVSSSAGGVAIGQLNEQFYRQYGAPRITLAPYSVDDERFAGPPQLSEGADPRTLWFGAQPADTHVQRQTDTAQTPA